MAPDPHRSRRRWQLTGLLLAALVLAAGVGAWWLRSTANGRVDTVAPWALRRALRRDAALPLSAAETDVLLIAVCTLRQDRMTVYGHKEPTTPFLGKLARRGVVFEEHFTQAPWTRPAMGALLTGRWPRALKLDNPNKGRSFRAILREEHTLLSEVFRAHGYATVGAVANPNLKRRFGFAQGFDVYSEPGGTYRQRADIPSADEVVDDVLEMAAAVPSDQRLYARINVLDTHHPATRKPRYQPLFKHPRPRVRRYDAALRSLDAELARLYVALRRQRPNLLVVLAADHGEGLNLPRRHGPEHGNHVYRTTVQTPWIVHHPALPIPGRRVEELSMNVDVAPTILELLGLPPLEVADGISQAAAIRGEAQAARHRYVFAETFFRRRHLSTVYDGEHQLIRTYLSGKEEGRHADALYAAEDWRADVDLAAERPGPAAVLGEALSAWEAQQLAAAAAAPAQQDDVGDDDTDEMLRALGYVEGGGE